MGRLKALLLGDGTTIGQGEELDAVGELLNLPRLSPEEDKDYRRRLAQHPLVRLLTEYE